METEGKKPIPGLGLLKLLFAVMLLLAVAAGLCLWWLSCLSDVPPRP